MRLDNMPPGTIRPDNLRPNSLRPDNLRPDDPTSTIPYGRFQLDLAVYHVTGTAHESRLHIWLGPPDSGPLVATIDDPHAAGRTLSVNYLWQSTSPAWRATLAGRAFDTYTAWHTSHPTATRPIRTCEG